MTSPIAPRDRFLAFRHRLYVEHDLTAVDEYLHPQFSSHSPMIQGIGHDAYKRFVSQLHDGVPDLRQVNLHVLAEDENLMAMTSWEGTHTGSFLGAAATGKAVTFATADRYELKDGLLFRHWDVIDRLSASIAIGLLAPVARES